MEHSHDEIQKKIKFMDDEKDEAEQQVLLAKVESEREEKIHDERIKILESQITEAGERYENLRLRVRKDIRKIRENERDLEARLELMRKDSETLLAARDVKVLELQRKIDALEFDLDQIQDGRVQAQMEAERYLAKLSRVARALQIANSMIEDDRASEAELEELEPVSGGAANAEEPIIESLAAEPDASPTESAVAAEAPPPEPETEEEAPIEGDLSMSPELAALASEGEPTIMVSSDTLDKAGGESGSSSG
jgi:chromosome segregation ATPase